MIEDEYRLKKARLEDLGFVDYFDALGLLNPYPKKDFLRANILKKQKVTACVDDESAGQALHFHALVPYQDILNDMMVALDSVKDHNRLAYLRFNFLRLVNGGLTLKNAVKKGSLAVNKVGLKTKGLLSLGYEYLSRECINLKRTDIIEQGIFNYFDFVDFYRAGATLIHETQKGIKLSLSNNKISSDEESFLGRTLEEFLEFSFKSIPEVKNETGEKLLVDNLIALNMWCDFAEQFVSLIPFIKKFFVTFDELKTSGQLQDSFYLNYTVDSIDFEAIILSSMANYFLGNLQKESKLGLTIEEYCEFGKKAQKEHNLEKLCLKFSKSFGFDQVKNIDKYLSSLLKEHIFGYDFQNLTKSDFKHVGGPIILA